MIVSIQWKREEVTSAFQVHKYTSTFLSQALFLFTIFSTSIFEYKTVVCVKIIHYQFRSSSSYSISSSSSLDVSTADEVFSISFIIYILFAYFMYVAISMSPEESMDLYWRKRISWIIALVSSFSLVLLHRSTLCNIIVDGWFAYFRMTGFDW